MISADVKKAIESTVKARFPGGEIVSIRLREDQDHEGDPILRVDLIVRGGGKVLDPKRTVGLTGDLRSRLAEIGVTSFPVLCSFPARKPGRSDVRPRDFVATAELLAEARKGRPPQVHLRRTVSTAYYALFHALARNGADLLAGERGSARSRQAWRQVYRALEHGAAKNACQNQSIISQFPRPIEDFADLFVKMQIKRHDADCDPTKRYTRSEVLRDIVDVETALAAFAAQPRRDRQAFSVYVLFKARP